MHNANDYVTTIRGWRLYLGECLGGFNYEWRGKAQMDDVCIASGHVPNCTSRLVAQVEAELHMAEVLDRADALRRAIEGPAAEPQDADEEPVILKDGTEVYDDQRVTPEDRGR